MSRREETTRGRAREGTAGASKLGLRWVGSLLSLGLLAGAGYQLLRWEPEYLPVRVVSVDGELRHLSPKLLRSTVVDRLRGGIVTQDLATLKESVEALPWVRSASLRRLWPDHLELSVVEHEPLARWGADGLVSADGVVFRPPVSELPTTLPLLEADDARAPELVASLQSWRPRFEAVGLHIESIRVDARGAWSLGTDAGFPLALGKLEVGDRVDRFLSAWPSLSIFGRPAMVDMRYSNGLAVGWESATGDGSERKAESRAQARASVRGDGDRQTCVAVERFISEAGGLGPRRCFGPEAFGTWASRS